MEESNIQGMPADERRQEDSAVIGERAGGRSSALHPWEVELSKIQKTLDALEACPPTGWIGKLLWRGLRFSYRVRQRRVRAALEAAVLGAGESTEEAGYDFEPEMVLIPAGEFVMGSDPNQDRHARSSEQPQHTLYLPDYYIARTPTTNAQYAAFVQATGHRQPKHWVDGLPPRGKEDHPVAFVSWHDAVAYCKWLSRVTRKPYRLPSEAEWEKGARGSDGRIYPWGDEWDATRCNTGEGGRRDTAAVGAFAQGASPYGLLDMAGNVWEWTSSLHEDYPYKAEDGREDQLSPGSRVLRGGSWLNLYDVARSAYRRSYVQVYHNRLQGFRCCMSVGSEVLG